MIAAEGKTRINGYSVWYKYTGNGANPILLLHGGPGAGHDYLEPLEALASDRPVIFYDQLGCGKSDKPANTSLWQLEHFVREVNSLRDALDLEKVHLFGHSFGGILAIEYMLTQPQGVISLTLASTYASSYQLVTEVGKLKAALPGETRKIMENYETTGNIYDPEYKQLVTVFFKQHLCRLNPWPDYVTRSVRNARESIVAGTMRGPDAFKISGNLRDWDRIDRLGEIDVPTLITVGRYDQATPNCAVTLRNGIPDSELKIFENSAHMAHVEETSKYIRVLGDFLLESER